MKIAMLSRVVFLGGVTNYLIDLTEELIKEGHDVYLLSYGARYKESKENMGQFNRLLDTGIKFIEIDFPINKTSKAVYVLNLIRSILACRKALKKHQFDIIHIHTPILSLVPKFLGLKFVRTRHGMDNKYPILDYRASKEIAISSEIYDMLKNRYQYGDKDLYLIHNGVSKEKYYKNLSDGEKETLKRKHGISTGKVVIGLVASFEYNKGHDILLDAVDGLPPEIKEKIEIVFVGSSAESQINSVQQKIRDMGLTEMVKILPFQPLTEIYPMIDIMVLPSRVEGFGLVVIEAMLMGCCVVRSNTGGAYDQIEHGKTGYIFENGNIEQFRQYLHELVSDPEKRAAFAAAGQQKALASFTSEVMAKKTLGVYNDLLGGN
ncbi:glycosyltransferase family 4 protein [Neisseria dentiae]|uniref:glycosyltransferase family 4 protein n=1 Tax=Neisseria dentiae TaxID=194197 RepID=UPI00211CE1CD|nr:glycosyltransferase family 4 protein [Neisseria dentiae]MCQ9325468.1 glycosyltransferase family 4 protein [Neisseria dentiae]